MAFVFENQALDVSRRELRRDGKPVPMEPQVFDLLVYLIQNRDRVVSKDDVLNAIWGGRIVSESALTTRMNAARKALGDSGQEQRLIRTAARKGFRFVGTVREEQDEGRALPAAAAAPGPALPHRPSIAVLPFANMSDDAGQDYFADGITEDIITALSKWRSFLVIARNSTFTYKGRSVDVKQVARELGVHYVLEGSLRKSGNRVRISAQLIDAGSGGHVWAERYDGILDDVFDLQDRICASIVGMLEPQLRTVELQRIRHKRPESLEAYDYYLQALPHFYSTSRDGNDRAQRLLAKAIACDEGYALAHALLAYIHQRRRQQGWTGSVATERKEGLAAAERALALDHDDPTVLWIAGHIFTTLDQDRPRGRTLIDRSIAANANCAQAWGASGWNHAYSGNGRGAIDDLERALRLSPVDPLSDHLHAGIAAGHMILGAFDRMIAAAETSVRLNPASSSHWRLLAGRLAYAGRLEEAKVAIRRLLDLEPGLTVTMVGESRTNQVEDRTRKLFLDGLRLAGLPER